MAEKNKAVKKADNKDKKAISKYKITKPNGRIIERDASRKGIKKYYESKGWKVEEL